MAELFHFYFFAVTAHVHRMFAQQKRVTFAQNKRQNTYDLNNITNISLIQLVNFTVQRFLNVQKSLSGHTEKFCNLTADNQMLVVNFIIV